MIESAAAFPCHALPCDSKALLTEASMERFALGASPGLGFSAAELFSALYVRICTWTQH